MSKELLLAGTTLLDRMTRDLDINETQYDRAVKAYTTVGEWLCAEGSCVRPYSPNIYPQGSMRLGTVVKPRPEKEEFDVDLACELEHPQGITRETLREIVGKRIKESDRYKDNIEPRHRCWRLNYSDSAQFHLDIVPAIPDNNLRAAPPTNATGPGSILITDDRIPDWLHSNPKGYAEWFESRMQTLLEDIRKSLKYASVQDIPYHKRKTPLQKAIQVLKRHRDNMFGNNDHRPTSIIITTLAAHAYGGESDLYAALNNIMNDFEVAIKSQNGRIFILNPANGNENFADKWTSHAAYEQNFRQWLTDARQFVRQLSTTERAEILLEHFSNRFGERLIKSAAASAIPDVFKTAYPSIVTRDIPTSTPKHWGN